MRRRFLLWIAAGAAIGLSACTTLQPPHLAPAKACADWRWIGISRPGGRCPDVPGWTVHPLFPQLAPIQQPSEECPQPRGYEKIPTPEVIRELNRFCVYEITSPHKKLKGLSFPPAVSPDLVRLDQDCAALSPSDAEEKGTWKPDPKEFLSQAGWAPFEIDNPRSVRLAFLDTQPDGDGVPETSGNSPHGYTLAHIAQQLVCASGSSDDCSAQITTRLALPITEFDPKNRKKYRIYPGGGYFGMQSHLAWAIREEVDSWLRERSTRSQRHLVLNLSMAWDPALFGGLDPDQIAEMRAGSQAVYRALQYAAGYDVLVLAAAGNQQRVPCPNTGPLLPAAWERGVVKEKGCDKTPLLYAVGGVQSDGKPLFNARPGGMPPRAAFGDNAVVPSSDPRRPTEIYIGSSVATAVASSIAAVVWSSFPDWDSQKVMGILDSSGEELDFRADFWPDASASPPWVRRLSLCRALEKACDDAQDAKPCPVQRPCGSLAKTTARLHHTHSTWKGCCQPWVIPQPDDPPCLGCARSTSIKN